MADFSVNEHSTSAAVVSVDVQSDSAVRSPNYNSTERDHLLESPDSSVTLTQDDAFSRSISIQRNLRTNKISGTETFIHFLKGNIGSGMLSMPFAMSLVGIAVGPPLLVVVGGLGLYCMFLIMRCADHLGHKYSITAPGYGDTVQLAFMDFFNNEGLLGRRLVNGFLIATQLGFCSVYFILISQNTKVIIENYYPDFVINLKVYIVIILVFIMLTSFIWSMKKLAVFSMLGNIFIFTGLFTILVFVFLHSDYDDVSSLCVGHMTNLPIFFGMAIYSLEGIGLILPLRNQMLVPAKFPLILTCGMIVVIVSQIVFGVLGYICFRSDIQGIITFNMPDGVLGSVAQLTVALCIYLTYPLMFYVPVEILLPGLDDYFYNHSSYTVEFWLRTAGVMLTFAFAIAIPHIELFIALIGALASSSLALIFPPVAYLMVFRASPLKTAFCCLIIAFGVCGCVTGTLYAVKDIVCAMIRHPTGGPWPCHPPPHPPPGH